jgi:uncharacterized repeat protein (TIGR01451 family)
MPHHDIRSSNPFARTCAKALAKLAAGSLIASCLSLGAAGYAHSQIQRSFLNLGFEDPVKEGCTWAYVDADLVPGWQTTHSNHVTSCRGVTESSVPVPIIEIWRQNSAAISFSGDQHAELNAVEASKIYQTLCILEGDDVRWSFYHRGLAAAEDQMAFKVGETDIVRAATSRTGTGSEDCVYPGSQCSSELGIDPLTGSPNINGWRHYHGEFKWTAASANLDFGFEAISSGGGDIDNGNLLDNIEVLGLVPIVEFDRDANEGIEGEHNAANPVANIRVSGNIPASETLTVQLRVIHQDTDGADITPSDVIEVTIPEGEYVGDSFPVPLEALSDGVLEGREQLRLEIVDKPGVGGYRVGSVNTCGAAAFSAMTYTILDAQVTLEKTGTFVDVVGGLASDGSAIKNAGDRMDYMFTVTNRGGAPLADIQVVDSIIGSAVLDPARSALDSNGHLPAGAVAVFTGSYTITQADVDRGEITNEATLTATTPDFPDGPPLTATDSHTELLPHSPMINMVKTGVIDAASDDGDGLPDPGELLKYDITVTNEGNITALNVQPNDPGPTFNGSPGTGTMGAFTPEKADLAPGTSQIFTAYYTLTEQDIMAASGATDGTANRASVTGEGPGGELINIEMPEPVTMTLPGFGVEKRADVTQTYRGSKVTYTLLVKGHGIIGRSSIRLADITPPGFAYMANSATVDGVPSEPAIDGKRLTWDLELDPGQEVEVRIVLAVPASARPGTFTNIAQVERTDTGMVYPQIGRADVEIIPEPVFDCGEILGKVFIDRNRNGYQDDGETGLPGARVVSTDGMLITTDDHGRFSVACADMPNARIGSNYIMKLDPRSLPTGYRILSENPRVVRLTPGKVTLLNFATSVSRIVRLDLNSNAFLAGSANLSPVWQQSVASLVATLESEPSVLRIVYREPNGERGLANQRMKQLRRMVSETWKEGRNRYRLEIETRVETGQPAVAGVE